MGRPRLGEKPLTPTEKDRRYRQRQRGLLPNERQMTDKEKLAFLRAENRELRHALRCALEDASLNAQHSFNQEVTIKLLKAKLAKKESMP